ncbi:hypothetical protein [Streptomyces sp. TS71-3]|uniref:hypothetical protein n=1 Tax=Streptomyces sp. TS71-3 TaxID=2733862 RepID=UPI001AFD0837|nr:hypothetical protein [Streptomyces sp. TS71-3]GHJ40822.1 hypothetical protein Sm713_64310 [Streptomyces sp. TS71-3]
MRVRLHPVSRVLGGMILEEGRKYVDELQQLGTPVLADVVPRRYDELFAFTDRWATRGRSYDLRTMCGVGPSGRVRLGRGCSRSSPRP